LTVIDIKTGHAPDWVNLQLAGYAQLLRENGRRPKARHYLELKESGYKFRRIETDMEDDIKEFLSLIKDVPKKKPKNLLSQVD